MNNSQEIILAQISAIYDKPPFVKVKTGQMEMILKCVGLGKYYDEYAKYLEPYWYNRGFQNDIESYRIFVGLNSIFEDLLNAHSNRVKNAIRERKYQYGLNLYDIRKNGARLSVFDEYDGTIRQVEYVYDKYSKALNKTNITQYWVKSNEKWIPAMNEKGL